MPVTVRNSRRSSFFRRARVAAGLMGVLLFVSAATMSSTGSVGMPKKILYLFPYGDGNAIPKGNEREIAHQMYLRIAGTLAAKDATKTSLDLRDCPAFSVCDSVQVHAEQQDNRIVVKLIFSPLGRVHQHEEIDSDEEPCQLRGGTTVDDCLQNGLDLLAVELQTHNDKFHGRSK